MRVESIERWHWLVLSVAVGLGLWALHCSGAGDLAAYGEGLNDPRTFERALVSEVRGVPLFKDVWVRKQTLRDDGGAERTVHLVTGKFCTGRPDPTDGKYHWRPTVFVAPIPYVTKPDLSRYAGGPGFDQRYATYRKIESPTVIDFLSLLKDTAGVSYTHAWWDSYPLLSRLGGSVLLIGIVWPTLVNLLAFGRLTRPPEEKGIDLRGVDAKSSAPAPRPGLSAEELARIEAELESSEGPGEAPRPGNAAGHAVAKLNAEPVEAAAVPTQEDKHFTAKPDDFYPTDHHAHR